MRAMRSMPPGSVIKPVECLFQPQSMLPCIDPNEGASFKPRLKLRGDCF